MENEKKQAIFANLNISKNDEAFQGAMPAGRYTCLGAHDEISTYEGKNWLPVDFKSKKDGNVYSLSLKGLIQANGLSYSTRNLTKRCEVWLDGGCDNVEFDFKEKKVETLTRKRDTINGKAGSVYVKSTYIFKNQEVG